MPCPRSPAPQTCAQTATARPHALPPTAPHATAVHSFNPTPDPPPITGSPASADKARTAPVLLPFFCSGPRFVPHSCLPEFLPTLPPTLVPSLPSFSAAHARRHRSQPATCSFPSPRECKRPRLSRACAAVAAWPAPPLRCRSQREWCHAQLSHARTGLTQRLHSNVSTVGAPRGPALPPQRRKHRAVPHSAPAERSPAVAAHCLPPLDTGSLLKCSSS